MHKILWLSLSLVIITIDQLTKMWAVKTLSYGHPMEVLPFVNFTLLHNTGAAFSFLADAGGWQRWLFMGLAIIISIGLVIWLLRLSVQQLGLAIALALILGGALGKLIDRVIYGYVVDFIDVYYQTWHWPAFNVADSAITIGVTILLIDAVFFGDPNPNEQ
jgi:signal peptidase II